MTSNGSAAHVITAFSLAYGLLQLLYGPFGDRYGKFRVILAAVLASVGSQLGCALAPSLDTLIGFRALAGATAAGIIPLGMAWVGDLVPYAQRQATLARLLIGTVLGLAGGQLIGGVSADLFGWRSTFVVLATLYVLAAVLLWREWRRMRAEGRETLQRAGPVVAFVPGLRSVLALPWARVVLAVVFLEGAAVFGAFAFIPTWLHTRFALSLSIAGGVVSFYGLGGLLYAIFAPRLIARMGERGLARAGACLLSTAFASLLLAPVWQYAIVSSFAAGFGFYMLHSTLQTHATQMAPIVRGTAVSLFASSLFLGQSAGVAAAASLIDAVGTSGLFLTASLLVPALGFFFARELRRRDAVNGAHAKL